MSSTRHVEHATIRTAGYEIKDMKFVDDEELVIAACDEGCARRRPLSPECMLMYNHRFLKTIKDLLS
jgi:hypothetical protein